MTASKPPLVDVIAEVLAGHQPAGSHRDLRPRCTCGEWIGSELALFPERTAHQARAVSAALTAAAPIIAAQAKAEVLREAADWLTEMASGYTRESPRLLVGREIICQLRARADHEEFMAKAAVDPEGQRLADAAAALAG